MSITVQTIFTKNSWCVHLHTTYDTPIIKTHTTSTVVMFCSTRMYLTSRHTIKTQIWSQCHSHPIQISPEFLSVSCNQENSPFWTILTTLHTFFATHLSCKSSIHHISKVLYQNEIWWLWRMFEYSDLIVMFKKLGWDYLSFVLHHPACKMGTLEIKGCKWSAIVR